MQKNSPENSLDRDERNKKRIIKIFDKIAEIWELDKRTSSRDFITLRQDVLHTELTKIKDLNIMNISYEIDELRGKLIRETKALTLSEKMRKTNHENSKQYLSIRQEIFRKSPEMQNLFSNILEIDYDEINKENEIMLICDFENYQFKSIEQQQLVENPPKYNDTTEEPSKSISLLKMASKSSIWHVKLC